MESYVVDPFSSFEVFRAQSNRTLFFVPWKIAFCKLHQDRKHHETKKNSELWVGAVGSRLW